MCPIFQQQQENQDLRRQLDEERQKRRAETERYQNHWSHVTRKPVFGVYGQVKLKPAC